MKADQTWAPLGGLKLLPRGRNPRRAHRLEALAAAMAEHGFGQPLTVNAVTGRVIAGEGRVRALRKIQKSGAPPPAGIRAERQTWLVPIYRGQWPEDREQALALALNGGVDGSLEGDLDADVVAAILAAEREEAGRLKALALDPEDAAQYLADHEEEILPPSLDLTGIETLQDVADTSTPQTTLRLTVPDDLGQRFRRLHAAGHTAEAIISAGVCALEKPEPKRAKKKPPAHDGKKSTTPAARRKSPPAGRKNRTRQ